LVGIVGMIIAGVASTVIGSILVWQWGEAQKVKAVGEAKGLELFWDELEKWLPHLIVAIAIVTIIAIIVWAILRKREIVSPIITGGG